MNPHDGDMEISRRTWTAAIKLALVISIIAVGFAIGATKLGDPSPLALVIPVFVVAFTASWVQTGLIRRRHSPSLVIVPARRSISHANSRAAA